VRTSWGSATDRGLVREVNEDALLAYPPVFLVADGMGGHDAGDLASRIAVEEFAQLAGQAAATADDVHACFTRTAGRIRGEFTGGRQGGTTVAGVAVTEHDGGSYWLVFNVGDSRVYRFVGGVLTQITVDHTAPESVTRRRGVITRALGTRPAPDADLWVLPPVPGERFVVCSDGLSLELTDDEIAAVLHTEPSAQDAADLLVRRAVLAGGRDNVTVVVVDHLSTAGTGTGSFTRGAHAAPEDEDTDPGIGLRLGIDTDPLGMPIPGTRP